MSAKVTKVLTGNKGCKDKAERVATHVFGFKNVGLNYRSSIPNG